MSTQPKALFLADVIESDPTSAAHHDEAAAELRRLHQFAEDQIGRATAAEAALQMTKATHALKIAAVEAQRDALLEALRWIADRCPVHLSDHPLHNIHKEMSHDAGARARAAIKAVEEGK